MSTINTTNLKNPSSGSNNIVLNADGTIGGAALAAVSDVNGVNTTGTITSGTASLTVGSATGITSGMYVTGQGITPGTTVSNVVGTTVTLSANALAALSAAPVTFYSASKILSPGVVGGQLCRAWVNFNGTASGTFAGGASTVTRVAGSTTATVTTTSGHGLTTGNTVNALTGVVAGIYTVTVLTSTTFTITTVATTALTNASITFAVNSIRASYNVSSITDNGVGDYTVNFTTAMVDANYAAVAMGKSTTSGYGQSWSTNVSQLTDPTSAAVRLVNTYQDDNANTVGYIDSAWMFLAIFR